MSAHTLPTIHTNGTSREVLVEQLKEVYDLLREADKAMVAAAPNGRDYYPQGDYFVAQAHREHRERDEKIRSLISDYETLLEHVTWTGQQAPR